MSIKSSMLHVRVEDELKEQASEVLAEFGITVSDAVRILLTRVVRDRSLPPGMTMSENAYDAWFRDKVLSAIDDPRPSVPHAEAMKKIRKTIGKGG